LPLAKFAERVNVSSIRSPSITCALLHLVRAKKIEFDIGNVILWECQPVVDIKTSFNSAVDRVYLQNVSPHKLKHTAANWLMQSGKDPFKISDFLTMSILKLLKHYGHHNPDHQKEIAEAIASRPERFRIISGQRGGVSDVFVGI
jgi:integrase